MLALSVAGCGGVRPGMAAERKAAGLAEAPSLTALLSEEASEALAERGVHVKGGHYVTVVAHSNRFKIVAYAEIEFAEDASSEHARVTFDKLEDARSFLECFREFESAATRSLIWATEEEEPKVAESSAPSRPARA